VKQSGKSLKQTAGGLPEKPGIYFFLGENKEVLYIGKARSLRARVRTYFLPTSDSKVQNILAETRDIDYILTESEREAAFLEQNFIQHTQPKFNERLKDDKSFPYLKLTVQESYPGIYLTRRVQPDGARYFGPFSPALQARKTIQLINRHFGIRDCRESIPSKRPRPCLQHDLGMCTAPCTGLISGPEYRERARNALLFLEGKVDRLLIILKRRMRLASDRLEFEQAGRCRDLIQTLEQIKEKPRVISTRPEDKDILGFARRGKKAALYTFEMRWGKVVRSHGQTRSLPPGLPDEALLEQALLDYYRDRDDWPAQILLPFAVRDKEKLQKSLSEACGRRVQLKVPVRGKNRKLVELADRNALRLLDKPRSLPSALSELQAALELESPPILIEGYDISNTGGDESVGSQVVFRNGLPDKQSYRKFRIRTVEGPNDVASLKEVLHRRFSRILRGSEAFPDLVLVDGGLGQLNAARSALTSLGLEGTPLVSLAKREELLFSDRHPRGLALERTSHALRLLQHIRDEAHRFAITYHRRRRRQKSFASPLDDIPGIGPQRKKKLLSRYQDLKAIRRATYEELAGLIGSRAADSLKTHLKDL
jgi:excinuclease ABC subunit C